MLVQVEGQAYVVDPCGFHYEVVTGARVLHDLLEPLDVVANLEMEQVAQVVLVADIQGSVGHINAAA